MSMLISSFMFIALFAIAIAHLLWGFGRNWPIRDQKLLAQTVVGTAGVERVPRLPSLGVGLATLAMGIFALALADHDSGGSMMSVLGIGCGLIFLARGIVGYTPWWAAQTPEPSFRFNDRRVYSPICLFLGVGFIALAMLRFT